MTIHAAFCAQRFNFRIHSSFIIIGYHDFRLTCPYEYVQILYRSAQAMIEQTLERLVPTSASPMVRLRMTALRRMRSRTRTAVIEVVVSTAVPVVSSMAIVSPVMMLIGVAAASSLTQNVEKRCRHSQQRAEGIELVSGDAVIVKWVEKLILQAQVCWGRVQRLRP